MSGFVHMHVCIYLHAECVGHPREHSYVPLRALCVHVHVDTCLQVNTDASELLKVKNALQRVSFVSRRISGIKRAVWVCKMGRTGWGSEMWGQQCGSICVAGSPKSIF